MVPVILPTPQGIAAWVVPHFIDANDPFYAIDNEYNSIEIDGQFVGKQHLTGKGAGALPTAGALFGDIQRAVTTSREAIYSPAESADPASVSLEVYIRDRHVLYNDTLVFDHVKEGYLDDSYHYLIGHIALDRLLLLKPWLESRQCTLIATGNYSVRSLSTTPADAYIKQKAVV